MREAIVARLVLFAGSYLADDLQTLKAAAERYVGATKLVIETQANPNCSKVIEEASAYAAAKSAYYNAARKAMPTLLQMAKGEDTEGCYGREFSDIFQGFGEDRDEEATENSDGCSRTLSRIDPTRPGVAGHGGGEETANKFVKDFGELEGV
jgi:hypothetical protein